MAGQSAGESATVERWQSLPLEQWQETYTTLHMWTQIVGKIRLALSPPVNHWWHCALYVSSRGLTTSAMPYDGRMLEIEFDFLDHQLHLRTSDGGVRKIELFPRSVADFYQELMATLQSLGVTVRIFTKPQEVPDPIPFEEDQQHASYDAAYARRFWGVLIETARVFEKFRGRFLGKCSPVNFYWGSFDLAVTRFSGKPAPKRPGADLITREAYSHECISAGFWPGAGFGQPAYYSYTAPAPAGLDLQPVSPGFYSAQLSEFVLPHNDVCTTANPEAALLDFLQSSYEAGARLAQWDRGSLERPQAAK
jgi:hypothetical protein